MSVTVGLREDHSFVKPGLNVGNNIVIIIVLWGFF